MKKIGINTMSAFDEMKKSFCKDYMTINWKKDELQKIKEFNERWISLVILLFEFRKSDIWNVKDNTENANETREFLHGIYQLVYNRYKL